MFKICSLSQKLINSTNPCPSSLSPETPLTKILRELGASCTVPKFKNVCFTPFTVVCISLETRSVARQASVAVGWVKIRIWSMAQLKGLTTKFKLM